MPRGRRLHPDGVPQHIVNRGNRKSPIFLDTADYRGFLAAMTDAAERTVVRVVAFCLLPNHWHLVLWPYQGREISTHMQVLMNSHLRDLLPRYGLAGQGHVYQGRYRNHLVQSESHFLNVCRYVEANARRAGLCDRAEQWPWSSLACTGPAPGINLLSPWPVARPADWLEQVNRPSLIRPIPRPWRPRETQVIETSCPVGDTVCDA
jgi:putative transposase